MASNDKKPIWLCLVILLLPGVSVAWQQCLEEDAGRFACLAAVEIHNLGNLEFELALAEAARGAGKYDYATVVLERLVIMHPDQAGARLDLVILSLRAGDTITAAEHLNYLMSMPDPPPAALVLIKQLERQLNPGFATAAPGVGPDYQLQLGLGYDDNANLGIRADFIDLIIDGVELPLEPDASLSPDGRAYLGAAAKLDYSYSRAGRLQAMADVRQYEGRSDQDSLATSLQTDYVLSENRYLHGALSHFRTRDGLYLTRLGAGARQVIGKCNCYSLGGGVDLLEGSEAYYRSLRGRLNAEAKRIIGGVAVYTYGSAGIYRQPYAQWGNTYSLLVGADAGVELLDGRFHVGLSRYNSYDDNAYSPLFGPSKRNLERNEVSLGFSKPLSSGFEAYVDGSFVEQDSDVPLYAYDRFMAEVGLRLTF